MRLLLFLLLLPLSAFAQSTPPMPSGINAGRSWRGTSPSFPAGPIAFTLPDQHRGDEGTTSANV